MPPTHFPLRRAAAILSCVRSEIISRSNCANESRIFSVSLPREVVVLNCWVTDANVALFLSRISMILAKSSKERVKRSTL